MIFRDKDSLKKYYRYIIVGVFILLFCLFYSMGKSFLSSKIIGIIGHPGLQGELLFQRNIIYNFEKGNIFKHFKTDYLNYPFGENLGFVIANSFRLFVCAVY